MGFKRDSQAGGGGFKRDSAGAGGFKRDKPVYDKQSFLQQMFDVTNTDTGESYIYGNKPQPSIMSDTQRVIADTATRGWGDRIADLNATVPRGQGNTLTGGGNAEKTAAARERLPDYLEFPSDVIGVVGSAPYQVGSRLAGTVYGGLEGMLDAYGHQKNWVPTAEDTGNILAQGAIGAGTGAAGDIVGRWGGKLWNRFKPLGGAKQELYDAADRAAKRAESGKTVSPASEAKIGRADRMQEAVRANAEGRGGFEKMLSGMDEPVSEVDRVFGKPPPPGSTWTRADRDLLANLAHRGGLISGGLIGAGSTLRKYSMLGVPAMLGTALQAAGGAIDRGRPRGGDWRKLQKSILGSSADRADKKAIDAARDVLSKTAVTGGKKYDKRR
jgi:hypothetical protein